MACGCGGMGFYTATGEVIEASECAPAMVCQWKNPEGISLQWKATISEGGGCNCFSVLPFFHLPFNVRNCIWISWREVPMMGNAGGNLYSGPGPKREPRKQRSRPNNFPGSLHFPASKCVWHGGTGRGILHPGWFPKGAWEPVEGSWEFSWISGNVYIYCVKTGIHILGKLTHCYILRFVEIMIQ